MPTRCRGADSAMTNFPLGDYTSEISGLAAQRVEQYAAEARIQAAKGSGYVARAAFSCGKTLRVPMRGPLP